MNITLIWQLAWLRRHSDRAGLIAGKRVPVILTLLIGCVAPGLATRGDQPCVNWAQRSPATRPPPRIAHAMAYDGARGVTTLFGGYPGDAAGTAIWEWNGADWTRRSPATSPGTRQRHAMAYDSA